MKIKKIFKIIILITISILTFCFIMKNFFPAEWSFIAPHKQGDFVRVGNMNKGTYNPVAILLNDGRVIVFSPEYFEIYCPKTRKFEIHNNNLKINYFSVPVKLQNGNILLIGGETKNGATQRDTFIFNVNTNTFSKGPSMITGRIGHSVVLLNEDKILIAGGINKNGSRTYLKSTEIYNPKTNKFENGPDLPMGLYNLTVTRLDNKIYLYGGEKQYYEGILEPYNKYIYVYNDGLRGFYNIGKFATVGFDLRSFTVGQNELLIFNGYNPYLNEQDYFIQKLNSKNNTITKLKELDSCIQRTNGIVLQDGNLLFPGGFSGYATAYKTYNTAAIYNPRQNEIYTLKNKLNIKRSGSNTNILLKDGNVLIIGGNRNNSPIAEIYMFNNKIEK